MTDWGDEKLFQGIKGSIEAEVSLETIEWKRNYGRASKNVVINPKFVRFEPEHVSASNGVKSMIGQPILHTFWIECSVSLTYLLLILLCGLWFGTSFIFQHPSSRKIILKYS